MDTRILDYLEGMYSRKLSDKEVLVLDDMLSNETLESFKNKYEFVLAKKVDYFTPAKMQQLIDEDKGLQHLRESLGVNSFNELYEN